MWVTKKKLREDLAYTEEQLQRGEKLYNEVLKECAVLSEALLAYEVKYPLELGQVVYDVQLRSSKGRFTKTKASREHSIINEVVVDKKNYFNLVDRLASKDVFTTLKNAEDHIAEVCID